MALTNKPSCSFCGEDQTKVAKLIAGQNDTYICNDCVDVCTQVLAPASTNTGQPHFEIVERNMFCAVLQNYDEQTIMDMCTWIKDNEIHVWSMPDGKPRYGDSFKIMFESESDLVAFKLRWI